MTPAWSAALALALIVGAVLGLARAVIGVDATRAHLMLGARLASRAGPLQAVSPRLKLLVLLAIATLAAFTPLARLWAPYLVLAILLAIAKVPLRLVVERVGELLPFVLLAAAGALLAGDPARFALVLGRALVTVIGLVLLTSTTPLPDLLQAARRIGLPIPLVSMIGLALRYLVVLMDEGNRMGLAFSARAVGPRDLRLARPLGRLVGALAFRSLERSERIHRAMLARGYTGELPSVAGDDCVTLGPALLALVVIGLLATAAWWPA